MFKQDKQLCFALRVPGNPICQVMGRIDHNDICQGFLLPLVTVQYSLSGGPIERTLFRYNNVIYYNIDVQAS